MACRLPTNPKAGVTPKTPSLLLQSTAPNRKSHSQETAQQQSTRRTIHPRLQASRGGKMAARRWSFVAAPCATTRSEKQLTSDQSLSAVKNILKSYKGCVIDGRDIGSNVFKNAKIKLFIDVKAEIRAKRRHKQLIEQGEKSIYSRILEDINLRDKTDTKRASSPLIIPNNAIIINNSHSFKKTIFQINKVLKNYK